MERRTGKNKIREKKLLVLNQSLERPSWVQDNLHAYKNRYTSKKILIDYFVKSKGRM